MKKLSVFLFAIMLLFFVYENIKPKQTKANSQVTTVQDKSKHYCSVCNKLMTDDKGETAICLSMNITGKGFDKEFMQKQIGNYKYGMYIVCWECYMKSVGIRPELVEERKIEIN